MEVSGRTGAGDEKHEKGGNVRECEACNGEGVTTKADGVCVECEEFMCKKCFKDHLKAKQCRKHVFDTTFSSGVPLKRNVEVEKCKRHAGELIKFYCRTHETVGCGECMIPDHTGCSPESIKDLCKDVRHSKEFADLEKHIVAVESLTKENDTKIEENKTASAEMCEKTLNDIKQFRKNINTFLDNAETTIIQEAKAVSDANDTRLTKLEKDCILQSSRIAEVSGQLDPDLYSESGLFIQTVTIKSIVRDLQQSVSNLQHENNIKESHFVPDKQLQSLSKSLHNFGKINCSNRLSAVSNEETTKLKQKTPNTKTEDKMRLPAEIDNENRDCCSDTKIVVGSRVRTKNNVYRYKYGTVTHVGWNGRVTVQWDGLSLPPMRHNIKDIELI